MVDITKLHSKIAIEVYDNLQACFDKFSINTELRVAHFLAQVIHESANFHALSENLNYSADGLKKTFPKYFPGVLSESYAKQPIKIASRVYGNRMGNGDEASQEGYKFRGRGYIQLTGKENYVAFGKSINENIVVNPDIVATPKYGLLSAGWFWNSKGLNTIADLGSTLEVVTKVTKKVNGGDKGLDDRWKNFQEIYTLIKTSATPVVNTMIIKDTIEKAI